MYKGLAARRQRRGGSLMESCAKESGVDVTTYYDVLQNREWVVFQRIRMVAHVCNVQITISVHKY